MSHIQMSASGQYEKRVCLLPSYMGGFTYLYRHEVFPVEAVFPPVHAVSSKEGELSQRS